MLYLAPRVRRTCSGFWRSKYWSAFFVVLALVCAAPTNASASVNHSLGNLVVSLLPLATGEAICDAFGGENTDDLYLVTLQGAVSRAYKVNQSGMLLVTDSARVNAPLCVQLGNTRVAGQVGTVVGKSYVTTLQADGTPHAIVVNGVANISLGTKLSDGTLVALFTSQSVASDGPVVLVNDDANGGLLYRYDGSTWIPVPKPAGKWAAYHVVGTGTSRDVYAEDGSKTIVLFSGNTTTTLFDAAHPPVAGNPISCCVTLSISPFDGTGLIMWGTGQGNSYRVATFVPGQSPTLIAQAGTPPAPVDNPVVKVNPTTLWPTNWAGGNVLLRGSTTASDLSNPDQEGGISYIWDPQAPIITVDKFGFNANTFQIVQLDWQELFLGYQYVSFLPYGNRINSQFQGISCVRTTTTSELALWGYMPHIDSVTEDATGKITLKTNIPDSNPGVGWLFHLSEGAELTTMEGDGVFSFQYPAIYTRGMHTLGISVYSSYSPWVLHNFGVPTPPPAPTITSFTADPSSIVAGQGQTVTLSWATSNATVSIDNGIGTVSATGTITVSPSFNTTYTLTATNATGTVTATASVTVTLPPPVVAHVAQSTGNGPEALAPGQLFTLYGTEFGRVAQSPYTPGLSATSLPLPTLVGGCSVRIDGSYIPVMFCMTWDQNSIPRPAQVNAQMPTHLSAGSHTLVVERWDQADPPTLEATSAAVTFNIQAASPGLFEASGYAVGQKVPGWSLVTLQTPAMPGDAVVLYGSGFGLTNPIVYAGLAAPSGPLAFVQAETQVWIQTTVGGHQHTEPVSIVSAPVMTPGFAGLAQLGIQIPMDIHPDKGSTSCLQLLVGGVSSDCVPFPVAAK